MKCSCFSKLCANRNDWAGLVMRLFLGGVMFPHGAQKLLGWYGGYGYSGTMQFFTETMQIPAPLAFLVIMGESLGAVALILGFFSRFMAFGIVAIMAGAIQMVHLKMGFWMNWFGTQAGEGYEYHLLAIGLGLGIMLNGGGKYALDQFLCKKFNKDCCTGGSCEVKTSV